MHQKTLNGVGLALLGACVLSEAFGRVEEPRTVYQKEWPKKRLYVQDVPMEVFSTIVVNESTMPGYARKFLHTDKKAVSISMNHEGDKFGVVFDMGFANRLFYVDLNDKLMHEFYYAYHGSDYSPQMTSDGRMVYFVSDIYGNREVYRIRYDRYLQDPKHYLIEPVIDNLSENTEPSLNSDGTVLAYLSTKDNGRRLVYVSNLQTGKEVMACKYWYQHASPVLSADGKHLVYEVMEGNNNEVYYADLDNEVIYNVSDHASYDGHIRLSADGDLIVFQSERKKILGYKNSSIFMYSRSGKMLYDISIRYSKSSDQFPLISADGQRVAYNAFEKWGISFVVVVDFEAKRRYLFWDKSESKRNPQLSSNGDILVYTVLGVHYRVDLGRVASHFQSASPEN